MKKNYHTLISFLCERPIIVNVLVSVFVLLGIYAINKTQREIDPSMDLAMIYVTIDLENPMDPEQAARAIIPHVDQRIKNVNGVNKWHSWARDNYVKSFISIEAKSNVRKVEEDLRREMRQINGLPKSAKKPKIQVVEIGKGKALTLAIYGKYSSQVHLMRTASWVMDDLYKKSLAKEVVLSSPNFNHRTSIRLPQDLLHAKGLTLKNVLGQLSRTLNQQNSVFAKVEHQQVRVKHPWNYNISKQIEDISIRLPDGSSFLFHDLFPRGVIFESISPEETSTVYYQKQPAVILTLYAKGEDISSFTKKIRHYVENTSLSDEMRMSILSDSGLQFEKKMGVVIHSAVVGSFFVFVVLSLGLAWTTAFWASFGAIFSVGIVLTLNYFAGYSFNINTIIGVMIVMGILVDDAVVITEQFHTFIKSGQSAKNAAILSVKRMKNNVIAMMITSALAFTPLFFIEGVVGKAIAVLPAIIILVCIASMAESLLILPVHLCHHSSEKTSYLMKFLGSFFFPIEFFLSKLRPWVNHFFLRLQVFYKEMIYRAHGQPFAFFSCFLSLLLICPFIVLYEQVPLDLFNWKRNPTQQYLDIDFEEGTGYGHLLDSAQIIEDSFERTRQQLHEKLNFDPILNSRLEIGTNYLKQIRYIFQVSQERYKGQDLGKLVLRTFKRNIPKLEWVKNVNKNAGSSSPSVVWELSSDNGQELKEAAQFLKATLEKYSLMKRVDIYPTKNQFVLSVKLRPGYEKEIALYDLLKELDHILREQKIYTYYLAGKDASLVLLSSLSHESQIKDIEEHYLSNGMQVKQIAHLTSNRESHSTLFQNGKQTIQVYAYKNADVKNGSYPLARILEKEFKEEFFKRYPYVVMERAGFKALQEEKTLKSILKVLIPTILLIYAILAICFNSYLQPLLMLLSIPSAILGALIGHWLMGESLGFFSSFGFFALCGIVVNDAVILMDTINIYRRQGNQILECVTKAVMCRLRPIYLAGITTILGMINLVFSHEYLLREFRVLAITLVFGVAFSILLNPLILSMLYIFSDHLSRKMSLFSSSVKS